MKMLIFTTEFICGLLFGLFLGLFPHYKNYNQLCNINQRIDKMINEIEPGKKYRPSKIVGEKKYLKEIETLWKNFTQLFDKKIRLNPDFSFSKMANEICELLGEKGVAASTIKNFYERKTNPRRKTIEAIQEWINKEKKKEVENETEEDNENGENTNTNNNIIDNNKNSSNSES